MAIDYKVLPVYEQKEKILQALSENQVIVVQSPTGSGKTTQIPIILHEAGYDENGVIAVTQPRRIAALSVSEFISKQLGTSYPGLVGYKMRFEDKTDSSTKIKIMTDGILLQEMKLDPWLSKYSVMMVDEAHERSLNIDFVLGLLKRVLETRKEFKVIVSSATLNAEAFSSYFNNCPIVTIDTITYPVTLIYDPPQIKASTMTSTATDCLLMKISSIVERVVESESDDGGILIFLPGEKIIKDCMRFLDTSHFASKIHTLPLYGRLSKEDQERVFQDAPKGKKKIIISTNIAETSVTIADITTVIDSGLAKLNYYNPHTFTSSLIETEVSKASCNQRRGRAGRTRAGVCYRLYPRKNFEERSLYTLEEIYRTDLSDVVLQMSDLGITDFEGFDFISSPGKHGIIGAVETLNMLGALEDDRTLSNVGKMMVRFPLEPRISRIIVEAIMKYPDVLEESLIAASFLSANSPFVLPPGDEMAARKAHHTWADTYGDFVSYLKLFYEFDKSFQAYTSEAFCNRYYLDEKVMLEIKNIKEQLSDIINDMKIPLTSGGSKENYLCCVASGMIQFVCERVGKDNYRSLTQDKICIHPGSVMFKKDMPYFVAGEIVKTSRMFAMSVSPLTKSILNKLSPDFLRQFESGAIKGESKKEKLTLEKQSEIYEKNASRYDAENFDAVRGSGVNGKNAKNDKIDFVAIGNEKFEVKKIKGQKVVILPYEKFINAVQTETDERNLRFSQNLKAKIVFSNGWTLLNGEKLKTVVNLAKKVNLVPIKESDWNRKLNLNINEDGSAKELFSAISSILKVVAAKQKSQEYGFVCLFTDYNDNYYLKVSRGLSTALNESIASLDSLADKDELFSDDEKDKINGIYRLLNEVLVG